MLEWKQEVGTRTFSLMELRMDFFFGRLGSMAYRGMFYGIVKAPTLGRDNLKLMLGEDF